jgi:hypothetical protein
MATDNQKQHSLFNGLPRKSWQPSKRNQRIARITLDHMKAELDAAIQEDAHAALLRAVVRTSRTNH